MKVSARDEGRDRQVPASMMHPETASTVRPANQRPKGGLSIQNIQVGLTLQGRVTVVFFSGTRQLQPGFALGESWVSQSNASDLFAGPNKHGSDFPIEIPETPHLGLDVSARRYPPQDVRCWIACVSRRWCRHWVRGTQEHTQEGTRFVSRHRFALCAMRFAFCVWVW